MSRGGSSNCQLSDIIEKVTIRQGQVRGKGKWLGDIHEITSLWLSLKHPLPAVQAAGGQAMLLTEGHLGEPASMEIIKQRLPLVPGAINTFLWLGLLRRRKGYGCGGFDHRDSPVFEEKCTCGSGDRK